MRFEKPEGVPKPPLVDYADKSQALTKMLSVLQQDHRSIDDLRPDDTISPDQECTPNEVDARADFETIRIALSRHGVALEEKRVLEIGSGMGELLRVLRKKGVNAIGIDSNPRDFGISQSDVEIINAPLGALKPEKAGLFGVILAKNVFDSDRYAFQIYRDMLAHIASLLDKKGLFIKMGTGEFSAEDIPADLAKISGSIDFEVYQKQ